MKLGTNTPSHPFYLAPRVTHGHDAEQLYNTQRMGRNRIETKSQNGRRYFAVARAVNDGHAFVFDYMEPRAPKGGDMKGEG